MLGNESSIKLQNPIASHVTRRNNKHPIFSFWVICSCWKTLRMSLFRHYNFFSHFSPLTPVEDGWYKYISRSFIFQTPYHHHNWFTSRVEQDAFIIFFQRGFHFSSSATNLSLPVSNHPSFGAKNELTISFSFSLDSSTWQYIRLLFTPYEGNGFKKEQRSTSREYGTNSSMWVPAL